MKVAITSVGLNLDANVDPRFGRAQHILIIDTETMDLEAIENPNVAAGGGAGIQTAQMVAERGVEAVLTGNCGPNAFRTLDAAGIKVYAGASGTVRQVLEALKNGEIQPLGSPSVPGHFGTAGSQQ